MNPDQFKDLITVLREIADKQYSLTGASDWPMLVFLVGIIIALIALMWRDLGAKISGDKADNKADHEKIWSAMKDCQDDCCPRGKK